jgi:hypothetical protein
MTNIVKIEKKTYSTSMFIKDLKNDIIKLVSLKNLCNGILSNEKLSVILGQSKSHVETIKRSVKLNPKYLIANYFIEGYKKNLQSQFGNKSKEVIEHINKYQNLNMLKWKNMDNNVLRYHPNLKLDYFKSIDSKEKAYWLGWIFAEGYFSYDSQNNSIVFGVEISRNDIILIERFTYDIGYNLEHKYNRSESNTIAIYTRGKKFVQNLIEQFTNNLKIKESDIIGKKKSKNIILPEFGNRELDLAFLLGFYDGDGIQGETAITCGSKKFLEGIKEKYNIIHKIRYYESKSILNDRLIEGSGWRLSLGAKVFNEMMNNYSRSLPRKRKIFELNEEKAFRLANYAISRKKFKFTKLQLEKLVWEMPLNKITELHYIQFKIQISDSLTGKYCKKWSIQKPKRGYWNTLK